MVRKIYFLNLCAVIFIAINLRGNITTIGPLTDAIQQYYHLTPAGVGLLNSIPLIAFSAVALVALYIPPAFGMLIGLGAIIVGEFLRAYFQLFPPIGLFVGTLILGSGIAIGNVMLPGFIKSKFPSEIPKLMGIYSVMLNLSAIIGILFALPLLKYLSLPHVLGAWLILAFLALLVYFPHIKNQRLRRKKEKIQRIFSLVKNKTMWKITFFMGSQSCMAYCILAWYPKIIMQKGYNIETGANLLFLMQIVCVPFALFSPIILAHLRQKFKVYFLVGIALCYCISFGILLFESKFSFLVFASCLGGIPMGSLFSFALYFIARSAQDVRDVAKFSSLAQGFGYLLASVGPYGIGKSYEIFSNFTFGLIMMILISLAIAFLGRACLNNSHHL